MNSTPPKSAENQPSQRASNWGALFLRNADQTAFSLAWLVVVLGCGWYLATARGIDLIDIDQAQQQSAQFLVEVNSATKYEFECLPGIGPKTATAITQWRDEHGPFESIDALANVPGVSNGLLEKVRPFLHFESLDDVTQ
ncbi:ComEA family DNA-binding protein [Mariniblastus fucicola]|uniref:ComE operon protein 1 n=1 Tax=Mariniblastus fucicola TaxID=980251 RepID=A0A5B9P735_9BACT|nr:helix-hairpin-helix domain-containing protein [Mariniblastus fucicola]QEG20750.1 ComE operon protein 1 [Mariniblastus fucicola]